MTRPKSKEQILNSMHNLQVVHEKLCCEYWVLRGEGGYQTAEKLREVCDGIADQIKLLNAELLLREAMQDIHNGGMQE